MFTPLALDDFSSRTGITRDDIGQLWPRAERVVSLRDLTKIVGVQAMPRPYLERLLRNVSLTGDPSRKPYAGSTLRLVRMDPHALLVGQTFVERPKYQAMLELFTEVFRDFCLTRGIAKSTAMLAVGQTADGTKAIAHYLPPIIEEHGGKLILMDGVHRNFLVRSVGTTIESIVIHEVSVPFPCTARSWHDITVVEEKPPKDRRFFDLHPELFRDVKHIGIDG